MAGIASILPFIAVLTNSEVIETNVFLKEVFEMSKNFGVENIDEFLFALGIVVFFILIIGIAFKLKN